MSFIPDIGAFIMLFSNIFPLLLLTTASIYFAVLGITYSEISGVFNFGIEGIMLVSGASGFVVDQLTGEPWIGLGAAIATGGVFGVVIGFFSVTLKVNQIVLAMGMILLGVPLSTYLVLTFTRTHYIKTLDPILIPFVSNIPTIGPILNQNFLVYLSLALIPISWLIINRTSLGLRIRAVGEDPQAADSMGVDVVRIRYICLIVSSVLGALGGAIIMLGFVGIWVDNFTSGAGFVAVALVRIGNWKPHWSYFGALIFGFLNAFQYRIQILSSAIPPDMLLMIPYIGAIVVLIVGSRRGRRFAPKSLGLPYQRGQR